MTRHRWTLASHVLVASMLAAQACSGPDVGRTGGASGPYRTTGLCAGLPKLKVETAPGVCVGVAAAGFRFPRGIAERAPGEFFVVDMGSFADDATHEGSVWSLTKQPDGTYARRRLLSGLARPSGIRVRPDDAHVYIGTSTGIIRFLPDDTSANGLPRPQVVLDTDDPPRARHPLTHFVFDPRDPSSIYVNRGSISNVCEAQGNANPCPEAEGDDARGVIRHYTLDPDGVARSSRIVARGLRNSIALAVHPGSGLIVQGENGRDDIDKADPTLNGDVVPHDELNVVDPAGLPRHYGWPYCYDDNRSNPEYAAVDCSPFTSPALLLPARSAPLGMTYYTGSLFPRHYLGALILSYHGSRPQGHRLVMVPTDARGIPNGDPVDIIRDWDMKPGSGDPMGAPVDVLMARDGSLYVTEDRNGDVLRVVYDAARGDGAPLPQADASARPAPSSTRSLPTR